MKHTPFYTGAGDEKGFAAMEELVEDLQLKELAFFGKITAGFTHEVKNVLAIIKENAGLMEDILLMVKSGSTPNIDRLSRVASSIREQSDRGVELSNRLNKFAHSADHPKARVNLNETAEQLVLLANRIARLKEITLEVVPSETPVHLETSSVRLQMALFTAMECCWNLMPAGGALIITPAMHDNGAAIRFQCKADLGNATDFTKKVEASGEWRYLLDFLKLFNGKAQTLSSDFGLQILLPRG